MAKINYFLKFVKTEKFLYVHWTQRCQEIAKNDQVKQVLKNELGHH